VTASTATASATAAPVVTPSATSTASDRPVTATTALAQELIDLLVKIDQRSPQIFEWSPDKIKQELGPEKQIKILPRLGSGRDIELQVRTGAKSDVALLTSDLAKALGVGDPKIHQLPVTDGPVFRLSDGTADTLRFKSLSFEVDISAGDSKTSGIDLRGPGEFFAISPASAVDYVMVAAPAP
jgi:hypothetical protein